MDELGAADGGAAGGGGGGYGSPAAKRRITGYGSQQAGLPARPAHALACVWCLGLPHVACIIAAPRPAGPTSALLRRACPPCLQGGSQGAYKAGYGYGGGAAPPPVPGASTFQAAADGGALRDRSNDLCYK